MQELIYNKDMKLKGNCLKKCVWCKKEFLSWKFQNRSFCSNKCSALWKTRKHRDKIICKICHKKFIAISSKKRIYCSRKCYLKFKSRNTTTIKCYICNKPVQSPSARKRKYCSHKCLGISLSTQYIGKNNPAYVDGESKNRLLERDRYRELRTYRQWRQKVYKRDKYTCQECGRKRKRGDRVELNAHHIKSWVEHPRLRFKLSNGLTLCKECHRNKYHGKARK